MPIHRGCLLLLCTLPLLAQRGSGELRLTVTDPSGLGIEASGTLAGLATQVRYAFQTDREGHYTAKTLPFGAYRLRVERAGFAPFSGLVEIQSAVPAYLRVNLVVSPLETTVVVSEGETLLDPHRTGNVYYIGADALRDRPASQPSREVLELVNSQPGWLLEAGGVLHPRGAEYGVQYVVDGVPLFDNRSPAFAPALDVEELRSMNVLTGNYPAEYGRKLGGVIEVNTVRDQSPGLHGKAVWQAGAFATDEGHLALQYQQGGTAASLSGEAMHTSRYLDPPVEQNYTNKASGSSLSARLEQDLTPSDRLRVQLRRSGAGFLVPNETIQEQAGQRQDRNAFETAGQAAYQRILSPRLIADVRVMARDVSAALWSNPLSTPIIAAQERGFRETYTSGSLSAHLGNHELKAGGEAIFSSIHENFSLFDPAAPLTFAFAGRRQDREQSAFVQDLFRAGRFTVSAGLRWDHYQLLVDETAISPRLGVAWHLPTAGLVLRASYDRAFETPAVENILLASSRAAQELGDRSVTLPLRPSRGNFYQAGFSKTLLGKLRLDGAWFRRDISNFADDSLLLNSGVSFPIAFAEGHIHGFEAKLDLPRWGPVSGFLSYGNLTGKGQLPIAGGLFLGEDAADLLNSKASFAITQDQRNTARARFRAEAGPRLWFALGGSYGSGLPVELDQSVNPGVLIQQYGRRIVDRVNFDRGRVRPSFSLDASLGVELLRREKRSLHLQVDALNLTDRLNVINFAGLFSGTAVDAPRRVAMRLGFEF